MRTSLFVSCLVVAAACGGGGSSSDDNKVDASVTPDAAPPDAPPAAITGLGKSCVVAMQGADCPANANGCLGPFVQGGTTGFCTVVCVNNGTFMTNGATPPAPTNVMPADLTQQNATCAGIYAGPAVGTPSCSPGQGGVLFGRAPAGDLQPNTNYTFKLACGIGCGPNNTCPGTLTCNTSLNVCIPM